jgi:rhodanese-related sulfurtransferase
MTAIDVSDPVKAPDPAQPMREILEEFPSARRALFSAFHIGGCQSCAFSEEDSLKTVCEKHELEVPQVVATIASSHEEEQELLLSPLELKKMLAGENPPVLVDARTREEHEAVAIPGSELLTENTLTRLTAGDLAKRVIIYDHHGKSVLDHVSWFRGHGLKATFALAGGIDAYAQKADSTISRYRLEMD